MLIRETTKGVLAGLCISLGGAVFLACDNRVVGAVFFSVALFSICMFGFSLYTGRVGSLADNHSGRALAEVYLGLLGNLLGCLLFGSMLRLARPDLGYLAEYLCQVKLEQTVLQALLRAFFCGVLMYIAVWIYREKHSCVGIFLCIPAFILSGFEHSIANMFYFAAAGAFHFRALGYTVLFLVGNSVGAWTIPLLLRLTKEERAHEKG